MFKFKTFPKGGVHPEENKLSAASPIRPLPLPDRVIIPVVQHMGAPAEPVVQKGDTVVTGQLLAKGDGFVSANIHSSISGKIFRIEEHFDASGYKRLSFVIDRRGDDWDESVDRSDTLRENITASREDIIQKIQDAGIVGMGGATFPTHVKLNVPKGKNADILIINGVECEPFLTADHRLMLERSRELMIGIRVLMKGLGVDKAVIGIEKNKPDAIELLNRLAAKNAGITVQALKVKYPQGGEKQLIKAITGREVPSGALPVDVGAVVHNVGTTLAAYEAVQKNKPLVERIVTVTGKSVKKPSNFLVRIGTPIAEVIEAAGGLPDDTGKVVLGGPMMGKAVSKLDIPVTKGTSGILIIPEGEAHRKPVQPCIRCAKCVSVCPMGLEPYLLMSLGQHQMWDKARQERALDCIECGSCSFICPADRPLLDYIRLDKKRIGELIRKEKKAVS
ncbi:MAG TPA: electron transport complex subunit RsxC [Bacteroidetes bacterium]|nr:electron transport complex subunit RsxC [Bacteroidota bacterium]